MKKIFFIICFLCIAGTVFAERIELENGRIVEGHIFDVTDDYIRIYSSVDDEIIKLRFRNMSIDSEEKYRGYTSKPYTGPTKVEREAGPEIKTFREYVREGLKFAEEKKFVEAVESFSDAISIRNDIPDVFLFRAGVYQELGWTEKAFKDYSIVILRDPKNSDAYARRGWLYQEQGDLEKAIEDYSFVLKFNPWDDEILMERYNLYKETNQWWKAKADIDHFIDMYPGEADAYVDQAILNFRIGSYYNAWQSVYDAGKRGAQVPPDFIKSLQEKLMDPFLVKQEFVEPSFFEKVKSFCIEYKQYIFIALLAILLGVVVFLLPSKKKDELDPLKSAITEEEQTEKLMRIVTFRRPVFLKRFCAGAVDLILLSAFSWAIQLMTKPDIFVIVLAVVFLFRDSFGASPGKALLGLQVIDDHGYRGVFLQGFIRNFTLALPLVIFYILFWGMHFELNWIGRSVLLAVWVFYILECVFILFAKKSGQRIGDRMAGSYVHDLKEGGLRWPYGVAVILLMVVYLMGTVVLNMSFNNTFLYKAYPLRYYNTARAFSFPLLKGWKMTHEEEDSIVLENKKLNGSILLMYNEDVKDYSLDLCVSAFTRPMEESGLKLRTNKEIIVGGRRAFKIGFVDPTTNNGILIIYFKRDDWGELYLLQVDSPKKNMRYIMADATKLLESFKFH